MGVKEVILGNILNCLQQNYERRARSCDDMLMFHIFSGGIYGISGISMDIPVISMFQDPATHCHQIRQHTLTLYLVTGDMKQLRMSTFKE